MSPAPARATGEPGDVERFRGLARDWWAHARLAANDDRAVRVALEQGEWGPYARESAASEGAFAIRTAGGHPAVELLQALVDEAADEDDLATLGCGVVEELLGGPMTVEVARALAARADADPRTSRALGHACCGGDELSGDVVKILAPHSWLLRGDQPPWADADRSPVPGARPVH